MKELAKRFGFRLATYDRINIGTMLVELFRLPHCVTVLAGCGLVDRAFLAASRGGCVNGHPALLPGLRGFDVVEWALVENIPLGVTAHLVRPTVNAGDILLRREVTPVAQESLADYKTRLMLAQADTLAEAAIQVIQNRASPEPHDLEASRLCFAAPDRVFREAHRAFATKSAPTIDCAR